MNNINIESLNRDVLTFSNKLWYNEGNKNLLNLVKDLRLNIAPCTLWKLDQFGFNHLEIISISAMIGKIIHKLTTCEIDQLNIWESEKGMVFGYDQKEANNYIKARMDHLCYSFDQGRPQGVSGLFNLELYK